MQNALAVFPFPLAIAEGSSAAPDLTGDAPVSSFSETLLLSDSALSKTEDSVLGIAALSAWMGGLPPPAVSLTLTPGQGAEFGPAGQSGPGEITTIATSTLPSGLDAFVALLDPVPLDTQPTLPGSTASGSESPAAPSVPTESATRAHSSLGLTTSDFGVEAPTATEGYPASKTLDPLVALSDQASRNALMGSSLQAEPRTDPDLPKGLPEANLEQSGAVDEPTQPLSGLPSSRFWGPDTPHGQAPLTSRQPADHTSSAEHLELSAQTIAVAPPVAEKGVPIDLASEIAAKLDRPSQNAAVPMVDGGGGGGESAASLAVQFETSGNPSQPAGSFWESYFADFAAPEKPGGQNGQPTAQPTEMPPVVEAAITRGAKATEGMAVQSDPLQVPNPESNARYRQDRQDVSQAPAVPAATQGQTLPNAASALMTAIVAPIVLADWSEAVEKVEDPINGLGATFFPGSSTLGTAQAVRADLPAHSVIPQVAAQLAGVILKNPDNSTTLALAPEELGKVHLRLEADATNPDRMVVMISVERPETLDLFRRHASELAEALRDAGYTGADIGFGQHDQSGGQDQQTASGWAGRSLAPEDPGQVSTPNRPAVGASLDLRL